MLFLHFCLSFGKPLLLLVLLARRPAPRWTRTTRRTQHIPCCALAARLHAEHIRRSGHNTHLLLHTRRPVPRRTHLPAGHIWPPTLPRPRNVWHLTHTHAAALHRLFPVPSTPWTHTGCLTATNPTPTWSDPNLSLRLRARPRTFSASINTYISIYNYNM